MMNRLARTMVLAVVCGFGWTVAIAATVPANSSNSLPAAAVDRPALDPQDADFHSRTRSAIRDILASPEFSDLNVDADSAWRWLLKQISNLLEAIASGLRHMPGWLTWTLLIWMVVTLLAILIHLIYTFVTMLGGLSRTSGAAGKRGEHPAQLLGLVPLDFDAMYAEARRLLDAGDWLAATKHFYVAAILWLDRQGCIAFRLSKTNRDYVEELATRAPLQTGFLALTGSFEPVVYGGQAATMSATQDMAMKIEVLIHESTGHLAS